MSCLCVSVLQSGRLWARWSGAASSSSYFWGSAGASVVLTPAAATSPAAAVPTPAAVHDTVSKECFPLLVAFFTPVTFQRDLLSCCSPAAQFMRRGRWQRGARLLRFLCIPTTSRVFTLWFLSLLHPIRTQRSPPSPQWRPTWLEVRADKKGFRWIFWSLTAFLTN